MTSVGVVGRYSGPVRTGGTGASRLRTAPPNPAPPRNDLRLFKPELTPTWLSVATLLAGHLPPDRQSEPRLAYLGGGHGFTAAVVAAAHPDARVWWWDPDVGAVEAARRVRDAAGLTNLAVHEHPEPPADVGGGPLDLVVIDGLLDSVNDDLRAQVLGFATANLRPGGLLCVSYRTVVGWSEVTPVHHLVRHLVAGDPRPFGRSVPAALDAVERLRAGGAQYLSQRPVVDAWWHDLRTQPTAAVTAQVARRPLRPLSHAQVVEALGQAGCCWSGPARAADLVKPDLGPKLAEIVDRFHQPVLRETLTDLALRRAHRTDLFRLGSWPIRPQDRHRSLDRLLVTGQGMLDPADPSLRRVVPVAVRRSLATGNISVSDLAGRTDDRERALRTLLARGFLHPVHAEVDERATAATQRLGAIIGRAPVPARDRVRVVPALGSAIPAAASLTLDQQTSLGMR